VLVIKYLNYKSQNKKMKKILIVLILIVPVLIGCKALSKLTMFEMPFTQSITVPAMPEASETPLPLVVSGIKTNIDSTLKSLKLSADLIQKVKLKEMKFTLTSPEDGDLSFIKSVEIYITANDLDDVKIASTSDVTDDTKILVMTLADVDLKDFIMKDEFGLKVLIATDEETTVEQKIDISFKFLVDLKILGL
jgi:hypothetical protein